MESTSTTKDEDFNQPSTSKQADSIEKAQQTKPKNSEKEEPDKEQEAEEIKYFECESCNLRERYEYFGKSPPFLRRYKLNEDSYVMEDPFMPPKRGEILVLGSHCIMCQKSVCKDTNCSIYYAGTYCISCGKNNKKKFPANVQERLNRVVVT